MAKYYWLKLHRGFFTRHDSRIIESQENGEKYLNFYLKLLCESIDHEGRLRFSDAIPYDEHMLATITNTDVDTVRSAVKLLMQLQLIEKYDDDTLYMTQVADMIGSETGWASKKRDQRQIEDIPRTLSGHCPTEREIELEIDKERGTRYDKLVTKYGKTAVEDMLETVDNYCASKGKRYKDKVATAANWLKRDGVATLPGYGMKAAVKLPTCPVCGGTLKEYEPGGAMCENKDSEWKLLNDLCVEVADVE